MTERNLQINNKSTSNIGLPVEYKEVIIQYIWNSFEAHASLVDIQFNKTNVIGNLSSFKIIDNGEGIPFDTLEQSFGFLLDSPKVKTKHSSLVHGGKGKGRLSFQLFSGKAQWDTTYQSDSGLMDYTITIRKDSKDKFNPTNPTKSNKDHTGTELELLELSSVNESHLSSYSLKKALILEFGWFLKLNEDKKFQLCINGEPIDYTSVISIADKFVKKYTDEDSLKSYSFNINYIQWNEKIGENSFYHFLNKDRDEVFRDYTSFNKSGGGVYGFYHSLYIISDFFDNFDIDNSTISQTSMLLTCKNNSVFKQLTNDLREYLLVKRKEFYKEDANKIWENLESKGSIPDYGNGPLQDAKKDSLKQIVQELYTLEPAIFLNLKPKQEKTILGLMDLVIDSNERDNVMKIVDGVVNDLTQEERKEFASVLDKIKFSSINSVLKLVENREKAIEGLRMLVFELKKFTNERDHIQKAVQDNTWIFGEEFTTVSNDKDFESSLMNYIYILDGYTSLASMTDAQKKRRMDIFMCRQRLVNDANYGNSSQLEENVIIELKRPSVILGTKELRQVQDYRNIIKKEPKFHSQMKIWKFFLVGNNIDDEMKAAYRTMEDKGKRFLVDWQQDFEIYAMTWSDIFDTYRIRNSYLLNKLDIDKSALRAELALRDKDMSSSSSDILTSLLVKNAEVAK